MHLGVGGCAASHHSRSCAEHISDKYANTTLNHRNGQPQCNNEWTEKPFFPRVANECAESALQPAMLNCTAVISPSTVCNSPCSAFSATFAAHPATIAIVA